MGNANGSFAGGSIIRDKRVAAGLSQEALARLAVLTGVAFRFRRFTGTGSSLTGSPVYDRILAALEGTTTR
jgi:hypothetical protein